MEKLKKKIFGTIVAILTIFLVSVLVIFNFQDYNHERTEIENKLNRMEENKKPGEEIGMPQKEPEQEGITQKNENTEQNAEIMPVFMDTTAYTVKYNENNEVTEVLNYAQNDISENEIKKIAENILNTDASKSKIKIGNLYFDQYSYSFSGINSLTIIDNTTSKNKLESLLKTSVAIFILIEIAILVITIRITKWIIKPVIESFTKQKQFIADASHELKTPIAVIMANAEILEKEPQEKKWINNIKSESERMNELITNLLDLAKLEEGKSKEFYKDENLSKLVEKTVLTFEGLIYEEKLNLEYNIEKDIKLKCNESQIKQLVAIFLDNAVEHCQENGKIKVELKKQKSNIILSVSNTGKEIPKEIQEKIFERFYRADESRNRDSNRYGLGLAIAKNIVNNHNGKISVKSENEITEFKVIFK